MVYQYINLEVLVARLHVFGLGQEEVRSKSIGIPFFLLQAFYEMPPIIVLHEQLTLEGLKLIRR